MGRGRLPAPAELELAGGLGSDLMPGEGPGLVADQDLPRGRLPLPSRAATFIGSPRLMVCPATDPPTTIVPVLTPIRIRSRSPTRGSSCVVKLHQELVEHRDRRAEGPQRVVAMRPVGAEDAHHTVAGEVLDLTAVSDRDGRTCAAGSVSQGRSAEAAPAP